MFIEYENRNLSFDNKEIYRISNKIIPIFKCLYIHSIIDNKINFSFGLCVPKLVGIYIIFPLVYLWNMYKESDDKSWVELKYELSKLKDIKKYKSINCDKTRIFHRKKSFLKRMELVKYG